MPEYFSDRLGLEPDEPEPTISHDAPYELRGVLVDIAYEAGLGPRALRSAVCRILLTRADPNNWSPFPNIDEEVRGLLDNCAWHHVYDVIEAVHDYLVGESDRGSAGQAEDPSQRFADRMNRYFRQCGIAWQLRDGRLEFRGQEQFEVATRAAVEVLQTQGRTTAANESRVALRDLSRRPTPDATGAIQHALASLECVMRDVCGDQNRTLGALLDRYGDLIPAPLDKAIEKVWGYASEQGRHLREGRTPSLAEAELVVHVTSAVALYLAKQDGEER